MDARWLQTLTALAARQSPVTCPICGSKNIHYKETKVTFDGLGYADIWCSDCRHGYHISRGLFGKPLNTSEIVPSDLIY